jgi:hypothetical protein
MGGALFFSRGGSMAPLASGLATWLLLFFLLFFSLAEMPVMIVGMRHMVRSSGGRRLALLTNAAFTFFAAVYAVPFLLLTGRIAISLALAGLSLIRLAGALLFVAGQEASVSNPSPPPPDRPLAGLPSEEK